MYLYSTTGIILSILLQLTGKVCVTRRKSNVKLGDRQSELIVHRLGSALDSGIISSIEEISSMQELRSENNITTGIDKWITSILSMTGEKLLEIISSTLISGQRFRFEYNISDHDQHNHSHIRTLIFPKVYLGRQKKRDSYGYVYNDDILVELQIPEIQWNYPEDKQEIHFEYLPITLYADTIQSYEDPKYHSRYHCDGDLENFTATRQGSHRDIKWGNFYVERVSEYRFNETLTTEEVKPAFPAMMESFNNSVWEFSFAPIELEHAFNDPVEEIISIHPDFLSNPNQYYYLIKEIPYFCFVLKRIVIRGLSNLEYSLNKDAASLLIRNIQGNATLDYGFEEETDLELSFQIDTIRLQNIDIDIDFWIRIYIAAENYTVTRMKSNVKLGDCQSELIVDRLGSALASGMISSMEGAEICDTKVPLEKIEIANGSDWNAIKESYKGRIPFNDDD